jgi:hypothetical protein
MDRSTGRIARFRACFYWYFCDQLVIRATPCSLVVDQAAENDWK